jgi:hypothetical protein
MTDIKNIINELLLELSVTYPFPNMKDREQVFALLDICEELGYDYLKPQLEEMFLNEAEGEGESKLFPGKFHLGGGFYSSKNGGEAELKNEKGNLRPVTPEEKAKFDAKNGKGEEPQPTDEPKKDEPTAEKPADKPEEKPETPTGEKPSAEQPEKPAPPQQNPEVEQGKKDAKEDPQKVLSDPKATAQSKAMARAFKAQKDTDTADTEDKPVEGDVKTKSETVSKGLKNRKSADGEDLDVETTENGSILIGVEHGEGTDSTSQTIEQIKTLPKNTKVMFVGEGGMTRDDEGNLDLAGEQAEIRDAVKGHFDNSEESSWDENANVFDDNSPVYDEVAKSLGNSKSKAKAAIWSNMYGQDGVDSGMDAEDYLDDEGKEWLIDQAKKGGSSEFDGVVDWNNLSEEQKTDLYELNYRDDEGYGETEISKAQQSYNGFRQKELDKKIKEAEDKGFTVIAPVGNSHVDMWRKRNKKNEFKPVEADEVSSEMPEADKEIFNSNAEALSGVQPAQLEQFNTDIDKVAKMISDAEAKGEPAPDINLCDITIPGTNLYCDDNKGIPREEMPQFKGKAVEGSRAASMETDKDGEVDTEPIFREMLKQKNVKVLQTKVPADKLKATQKDLVGGKVIGMMGALEKDPTHPKITAPIYVSRDGYVIDGHHRWAAIVAYNAKHPDAPIEMKSTVIDMDIKDAIPMANKFAEDMGIAAKKADVKDGEAPKEEPKVTDDKVGAKATTGDGKKLYHIGNGYYSDSPNGDAKYIRVESVVKKAIEIDAKKWWRLLFEENIKATVDGGEEGVFKEIPKDDVEIATDAAKQDGDNSNSTVTPVDGNWEEKAINQLTQPKYDNSILDDNLKKSIAAIIGKMTAGQDLTDEEKQIAKDYIKIVQSGGKVKLYVAAKKKGDWPQGGYVKVELGTGNSKKKWADEAAGKYDITSGASSQGVFGKKQNSPAKTNPKRKKAKIEVIDDNTIMFNGQKMEKLPVMTFDEIKAQIKSENPGLTDKELSKKAAILEKRIRRYNDNIDAFKEIAEDGGGEFEYVDYGDVDTPENRGKAIQNMASISLEFFKEKLGDKADLPENKLVLDSLESLKKFEGINLETDEAARKEYEQILSDIIVHMTNSKDFRDGVADFAEQKVAMELLGKGYPTYLPSDEAFKTADVLVVNPAELSDLSEKSKSLQLLYVTLEFSGGISVKYQGGGAGNSDEKVKKTRFKNNETRKRVNGMLGTYDTMYPNDRTPPNFPPSQEKLDELNSTHEDNKKWAIENGVATEEELAKADEWADKRIEAVFKTFSANGVGDCMSDDEKNRFKENMRAYYKNQKLMEVIYNNDADYTMFGNSNQKIKVSKGKAVANESDTADGVEEICYMKIKDDVGFNYSKQGDCTVVKPSNRNPSEIHSHKPSIK